MLDQRRAEERGYITLKEAAKIANYTPDYVGQLIRAGKIKGEQVYSQVAWVTTEDEIQAYLNDKTRKVHGGKFAVSRSEYSKPFMYGLIAVVSIAILLLQYVLYVSLDAKLHQVYAERGTEVTMYTSL